jgi:hypothetical protein
MLCPSRPACPETAAVRWSPPCTPLIFKMLGRLAPPGPRYPAARPEDRQRRTHILIYPPRPHARDTRPPCIESPARPSARTPALHPSAFASTALACIRTAILRRYLTRPPVHSHLQPTPAGIYLPVCPTSLCTGSALYSVLVMNPFASPLFFFALRCAARRDSCRGGPRDGAVNEANSVPIGGGASILHDAARAGRPRALVGHSAREMRKMVLHTATCAYTGAYRRGADERAETRASPTSPVGPGHTLELVLFLRAIKVSVCVSQQMCGGCGP